MRITRKRMRLLIIIVLLLVAFVIGPLVLMCTPLGLF